MKAVIVDQPGATPHLAEIDPPDSDAEPATVVAAAMNPVDVVVATGTMPFRPLSAGSVVGLEGVARTREGALRYFFAPAAPFGAYAEEVPLRGTETAAVPDGLDAATAAAIGTPGLAAWLPLTSSGLTTGDTVLVLGAGGSVGRFAVQFARILGAGRVVGVARGEAALAAVRELGADAVVSSDDPDTLADRLRDAAPHGVDVIIDLLWGHTAAPAIAVANQRARYLQIGNAAGPAATIIAPVFRNKLIALSGHSNFAATPAERRTAYEAIAAHVAHGEVAVEFETLPLSRIDEAWARLAGGHAGTKLILQP